MSGALQAVFQNQRSFGPIYMDATATGATVTTSGNYKIASFLDSGDFTVSALGTDPTEGAVIEYLVVAGGAGTSRTNDGAGGSGGGGA
jgi:hypothetical protein